MWLQKICEKQVISIDNFLTIYVIFKKFHWKDQQIIIILIGCFNNEIFFVVQHIIENNPKKHSKITWDILNNIYAEKNSIRKFN